jgi:enterobactin synthetase component D
VRKRQAEFLFGRLAARHALERLGFPEPDQMIAIGAHREPCWPSGIVGSISHAAGIAVAVTSTVKRHRGLGIDVEKVISPDLRAALLHAVLDRSELQILEAVACDMSLEERMTLVFSAKESLFKGSFRAVGHFFDFDAVRLTEIDSQSRRLDFALTDTLNSEFWSGRVLQVVYTFLTGDTILTLFAPPAERPDLIAESTIAACTA